MLRILSDTHLGRKASAHTSNSSSKALDQAIFTCGLKASLRSSPNDTVVHGGDLFDHFSNKEDVILQGMALAKHCDVISASNHDLSNRVNAQSSIEVVNETFSNVVIAEVSEVKFEDFESECGANFTVIPHHSSQDLFDKAVDLVCDETRPRDIVFIHANFNNPFAQNDASLNLTTETAEKLLKTFGFIVLGHEHNHRWEMGGRLLVLGNTHPTNFGDISDKFYFDYCPTSGQFTKTKTWDKETKYAKLKIADLISDGFTYSGQNFIEVVGEEIEPELAPQVAQALQSIWDVEDKNLYMVRNNVKFKQLESSVVDTGVQLEDVTQAISNDLKDTDLLELWEKHLGEAQS